MTGSYEISNIHKVHHNPNACDSNSNIPRRQRHHLLSRWRWSLTIVVCWCIAPFFWSLTIFFWWRIFMLTVVFSIPDLFINVWLYELYSIWLNMMLNYVYLPFNLIFSDQRWIFVSDKKFCYWAILKIIQHTFILMILLELLDDSMQKW